MATTFRDLIAENKRKSFWLVAGFCLFIGILGFVLGLALLMLAGYDELDQVNLLRSVMVGGGAAVVAFLFSLLGYFAGDRMVLGINGAKPIEKKDDPQLFNVVEEMSLAAGVPMPKVYLIYDEAPNAFATGRDPKSASVAITTGLRRKLNREELQGVIAHEMAHIRNFDIRLMLLLAVLIGTVVMLADFFWQALRFGSYSRSSRRSDRKDGKGGGVVVLVLVIVAVLLAIIAPILARIIQLAVSRQREYLADATAVQLTRDPIGLANALRKIDQDPAELKTANRGTAHLFIANPIKKFNDWGDSVFASHPPIKDRVSRLLALTGQKTPV